MAITVTSTIGLTAQQKENVGRGDIQWDLMKNKSWQCCLNCEWFSQPRQVCTLKGVNQTPPPHIILVGCKDHETGIPF